MAQGGAVYDPDRLPWLTETRRPRRLFDSSALLFWAFVAIVLVAGIAYWLGMKSVRDPDEFADILGRAPPVATQAPAEIANRTAPAPPARQVQAPGLPDVSPVAEPRPVPIPGVDRARPAEPKTKLRVVPRAKTPEPNTEPRAAAAAPATKPVVVPRKLQAWPADQSANAYGRVVRVGTFYSRRQAKQGWARLVRVYPGMRRLRAVVVANPSLRNGRTFYRLQFGTTSQAHSAVLCQRMRVVGQSCVTVGLPGGGPR